MLMLTTQDLLILTRHQPGFLGVFSINTLPELQDCQYQHLSRKRKNSRTLIANLDSDHLPGTHWVGIYEQDGVIKIFDSFGMAPPPLLQAWAARNLHRWVYEKIQVQHPLSVNCGYFAFVFVIARQYFDNVKTTVLYISSLQI